MGKLILVSGENNSGKSVFAENMVAKLPCKRYYVATMIPKTDDNLKRIEKHKKQREGMDFVTLELPYILSEEPIESVSAVLVEDVSNLLANNLFDKGRSSDEVLNDILMLLGKCSFLVLVTVSGLENSGYDGETAKYIEALNEINKKLYDASVVSVVMKNGEAVWEKGSMEDVY